MSGHLTLETLIAIVILLFYTISAPVFEKYHFHYMHESGLCMIIGTVITLIAMLINPESNFAKYLKFDDEFFFTFILPPIIFAAGYNLRRRSFFKYFLYIFLFGVIGTLVTFSVVAPLTYVANQAQLFTVTFGKDACENHSEFNISLHIQRDLNVPPVYRRYLDEIANETASTSSSSEFPSTRNYTTETVTENPSTNDTKIPEDSTETSTNPPVTEDTTTVEEEKLKSQAIILNFSLKDILLFASVISATDTVAALTFVKEEAEPKLFAILFGEGVINDAVCIVLYGIVRDFQQSSDDFSGKAALGMLGSFLNMFFFSFVVGAIVGSVSSVFLKNLKHVNLGRVQECSIIIFFSFLSYTLTEELTLSPIIALLFTGIFMSHYSFYNLSFQAREESSVVSRIMSNIAEAFVFTYLGLTVIYYTSIAFSLNFILFELVVVLIGRIISIYGLSYIMSLLKLRSFNLRFSQKGIMCCAGSIRGAIAFGLAISIDSKKLINKEVLISSTLTLVFFTTIVFGALMPMFIKFFHRFDDQALLYNHYIALEDTKYDVQYSYLHPNFSTDLVGESKEKNINKLKERLSYWLGTYWVDFDNVYMKPKLISNWPDVKKEHDEIAEIIKDVIKKYISKKEIGSAQDEDNENNPHYRRKYEADYIKMQPGEENKDRPKSRDEIMHLPGNK